MALNPPTLLAIVTYFPGMLVKASATVNGWEQNFSIFLDRNTRFLSASDNSSIPRMAMISERALFFWKCWMTRWAVVKWFSPTMSGIIIREVLSNGSTEG